MKKLITSLAAVVVLAGCATSGANYQPIVDRPGANYHNDLADCQQHATRVMGAADSAVAGAIAGAIFGALLGAAIGGNSRINSQIAGAGALQGGAMAAANAEGGQRGIITRCLSGRGYMVLQ